MTPSIYMCAATQFHRKYQNYEDYHFLQIEWDLWKRAPNVTVRPFKLQTTTRKDKKEEKKTLQTALTSFLAEHRLVLRAPCFQLHWDFFLPCTVKQNPCSEWEKTGLLLYKNLTSCSTDAPQTHSRLKFSLKKKKKELGQKFNWFFYDQAKWRAARMICLLSLQSRTLSKSASTCFGDFKGIKE